MDPGTESALQAYRAGLPAQAPAGPLNFGSTTVAPAQWNKLVGDEGGDVGRFNAAVSAVGGPAPTVTQTPILLRDDKGQFGNATLFKVADADGQSHLVDAQGATYTGVDDYLQNNQISDSWTMIRPAQPGAADGTPQQLVSGPAHNTTFMQQVGNVGDKVAGPAMIAGGALVLGASAFGEVGTAGLATPVAAPAAMWGGGLIATGAAWTAGRSGGDLINRYRHGRSLAYSDPQARADYLGLVGAVGGGAGALAKGLGAPLAAVAGDRIALATGAAQLGDQAGQLHDNWQNLTPEQRIQHGTELAAGVGMMAMPLANRSIPEGSLRSGTDEGADPNQMISQRGEPPAATPNGRKGGELNVVPPVGRTAWNSPTSINGRNYSGHALDQMQARGIFPSLVENTIKHGNPMVGKLPGTSTFYDPGNNVTIITNTATGRVVTASWGLIKQ